MKKLSIFVLLSLIFSSAIFANEVNEKELQKYFENNLKEILGLEFIATEFVVGNFRLDTVAFDEEAKSFKIIEYKNLFISVI